MIVNKEKNNRFLQVYLSNFNIKYCFSFVSEGKEFIIYSPTMEENFKVFEYNNKYVILDYREHDFKARVYEEESVFDCLRRIGVEIGNG